MELFLPIAGVEIMAWQLVLLGLTVGVIGGFFGIGGAFMVTPALNVFGFPMAYAIGTDMAHIAGKSIVATAKHRKLGNVDMRLGLLMVIFTAVGIELGASLILYLEKIGRVGPIVRAVYMILLFGLGSFMLYEYFKLTRSAHKVKDAGTSALAQKLHSIHIPPMIHLKASGVVISLWVIGLVATFTGFLAGFLGVGGGFIRMPALMYVIGCPTTVAVGTDLFEVMISGAYGAFSYASKARVELVAAVVMLLGAAIGAQFGTVATKYVKGLTIRLYFAVTMMLAGVSVIFKTFSAGHKAVYEPTLNAWAATVSGLSGKGAIREWVMMNKGAVKEWFAGQSDVFQTALAMEKQWNSYSGYMMLGAACALSLLIIVKMVRGVIYERKLHAQTRVAVE